LSGAAYLERYPVVHSRDSELARDRLYATYGVTGFERRGSDFSIHANYACLTSIGLAYCAYDSAVSLSFPEADFVRQFFSIQGSANFSTTNTSQPIGKWSPFVSAESRLRLDFESGYRQLVVRIDVGALERSLKSLLGDASDRKLIFAGDNPDPVRMLFVRRDIFQLAEELGRFGADYSPLVLAEMERSLIFRFLLAHRHNFTDQLMGEPASANRGVVELIEAFIEANWDKPIDVESLARLANVSARTIFREFALAGRGSPGQFAKRLRLQRAAEFLGRPDEETSVTAVALKCGFQNLGRFASDYARLIGEWPSETLKRSKK
jgi:AraC-like DNA-binding protein